MKKFLAVLGMLLFSTSVFAYPNTREGLRPKNRVFQCGPFSFVTADSNLQHGFGYSLSGDEFLAFDSAGKELDFLSFFVGDFPKNKGFIGRHYPYLKVFYLFKIVDTAPAFADPAFEIRRLKDGAVQKQDVNAVDAIYKCHEDPVQELFEAIQANNQAEIQKLLAGSSVVTKKLNLAFATLTGNKTYLDQILQSSNNKAEIAQEMLLYANDVSIAKALVQAGADPNFNVFKKTYETHVSGLDKVSYLTFALAEMNFDLARALIENGAKLDGVHMGLLYQLKEQGAGINILEVYRFLESQFLDIFNNNSFRYSASLYEVCDLRFEEKCGYKTYLPEQGSNYRVEGHLALAIRAHDIEVVKYLMDHMTFAYSREKIEALYFAASYANEEILQWVMSKAQPAPSEMKTAASNLISGTYSTCTHREDTQNVQYSDVCPAEAQLRGILQNYFFKFGNPEVRDARSLPALRFLLDSGADINSTVDSSGLKAEPAMMQFIWNRYYPLVFEMLKRDDLKLDYQAPYFSETSNVFGTIFTAYDYDHSQPWAPTIVQVLNEVIHHKNVNLTMKDSFGKTPQERACQEAQTKSYFVPICQMFN